MSDSLKERHERFLKWRRVQIGDDDRNLTLVDPVPSSDSLVDLQRAWEEFKIDVLNGARVLAQGAMASPVFLNGWSWVEFWALRHPTRKGRATWAAIAREHAAANERICRREMAAEWKARKE